MNRQRTKQHPDFLSGQIAQADTRPKFAKVLFYCRRTSHQIADFMCNLAT
jgi:hypothetical protein